MMRVMVGVLVAAVWIAVVIPGLTPRQSAPSAQGRGAGAQVPAGRGAGPQAPEPAGGPGGQQGRRGFGRANTPTFPGPPAGMQALTTDLFTSKNFYKDREFWSDKRYFR